MPARRGRPKQFAKQTSIRLTKEQQAAAVAIQRARDIGFGDAVRILIDKGMKA
jgi:hypothetical protein